MAFGKRFPKTLAGSNYPIWEEINLTKEQEVKVEEEARKINVELMNQCLDDAKIIMQKNNLKTYDNNQVALAIALFEKLAGHSVHHKEALCKEIFDGKN